MPLFSFHCRACDAEFETLVRSSDTPQCDKCGSTDLEKLPGSIAPAGKSADMMAAGRRQAAREGHFSNYSKAETKRVK
jgi:putative FmdB family regulatory protein